MKGFKFPKNIEIRIDWAILHQILRIKYIRNHKNDSNFSGIFVDFISRGDAPYSLKHGLAGYHLGAVWSRDVM